MNSTKKLLSIVMALFVAGQLRAPAEVWASPVGKSIIAIEKVNVVGTAPGQKKLSRKHGRATLRAATTSRDLLCPASRRRSRSQG